MGVKLEQGDRIFDPRIIQEKQRENPFVKINDIVAEIITNAILSSRLPPGSKLNIANIAKDLEISVTPVRNAMLHLQEKGLVTEEARGERNKCYYVFNITNDALEHLFVIRKSLEGTAAYLCAQRKALIDLDRIQRLATRYETLWQEHIRGEESESNTQQRIAVDHEFHKLLVRSSGNPYLIDLYASVETVLFHTLIRSFEFWNNDTNINNSCILSVQHTSIYRAIESGWPRVARSAAEDHIDLCASRCLVNRHL